MNLALASLEGILFALRWLHIFFGVIWIGMLYCFNYVQGAFMNEADAPTKSQVLQKLLPRALWWFRWGAFWTMATGLLLVGLRFHQGISANSAWGVTILTGIALGLIMGGNVWFVIWPNQQIVMANAKNIAEGKPADPNAATAGAKALLASRHNVLFSIPMLFYMAAARNLPLQVYEGANFMAYWVFFLVLLMALEFNALKGKLGPLTTIKGVITSGFALTGIIYLVMEILV